jgi:hypothetical protein
LARPDAALLPFTAPKRPGCRCQYGKLAIRNALRVMVGSKPAAF